MENEQLTKEEQISLNYLRDLSIVVIPQNWTYWDHSSCYKPKQDCKENESKHSWNEIPTDKFVTCKEMSFYERIERIKDCLKFAKVNKFINFNPQRYVTIEDSVPFNIKLLQPKKQEYEKCFEDLDTLKQRRLWEKGLGDGRHSKLPNDQTIYIIGADTVDEISEKPDYVVYGVLQQDLPMYAMSVSKTLEKGAKCIRDKGFDITTDYKIENEHTVILPKVEICAFEKAYKQEYEKCKKVHEDEEIIRAKKLIDSKLKSSKNSTASF